MSASSKTRTNRRRIRCAILAALLGLYLLTDSSFGFASNKNESSQISSARASLNSSIGLIDSFKTLNVSSYLATVLPNEIIVTASLEKNPLASALFDLIQYMRNNVDSRPSDEVSRGIPKYNRLEMFGNWVNEDAPTNCYNTRVEVLIRDAVGTPVFSKTNPCQLTRGEWNDPYSGTKYKLASAIDIDHVVPLKNAYRSGAHAWSHERRCSYANFLSDPKHLLAVSGTQNKIKGDRGPENYLPPEASYICEYVSNWLRIKAVWNLTFTPDEESAIETALRDNSCSVDATRPHMQDMQRDRANSQHMNAKCSDPVAAP